MHLLGLGMKGGGGACLNLVAIGVSTIFLTCILKSTILNLGRSRTTECINKVRDKRLSAIKFSI